MKFKHTIPVSPADIDEQGHVNNVVYVRYAQEAAIAHWNTIAGEKLNQQVSWVVLRHEIDYLRPAFAGDVLTATTWVGETHGVKSERWVELTNSAGQTVARAKTTWCMLDNATRKPKRIDESIIQMLKG